MNNILTSIDNLEQLEHDEISKALVALYRIGFEQIVYLVPLSQLKKTKVSTVTKDTYNNEEFYDIRELNEKSSSEEFTFDTLSRYYYQHKSLPNEFIESNISNLSSQKSAVSIRILSAKILRNIALFLLRFSKTQNRASSNRYSNSNALQRDPYCRSLLAAIIKSPSFVSNAPDDGL